MTASNVADQILRDFDERRRREEQHIKEQIPEDTLSDGNFVFVFSVDEEDTNFEWVSRYFDDIKDAPLLDALGRYWSNERIVYPREWVKMMLESAYNSGRSSMRGELQKTGEKP